MKNSFNDDVTHIELYAMLPSIKSDEVPIKGFEEREALPHEKAMLISMQLIGNYRHQVIEARLMKEPKVLDLSNFIPELKINK